MAYVSLSLAVLFLTMSCSSNSPKQAQLNGESRENYLADIEKQCSVGSKEKWTDISKNFRCITDINHQVEALLTQGNSPEALKMAKFGITYFPFDTRLINLFSKSLDVFKSVTTKMKDCTLISQRLKLLSIVSPDTQITTSCAPSPTVFQPTTKGKTIQALKKQFVERRDKKLEIKEFQNVSSMLKYQIAKNEENNILEILFEGINAWDGLAFSADSITVGKDTVSNQNFDLDITFNTTFRPKVKETCLILSENFNSPNGNSIICEDTHGKARPPLSYPLNVGKKNFEFLTQSTISNHLSSVLPALFVLRIDFVTPEGKKSYHYLWGNNHADVRKTLYNHVFDFPDPQQFYLQPSNHTHPKVQIEFYKKNIQGHPFRLVFKNLNASEFGEVTSAEIHYEPSLTYKLYQHLLASTDPVRRVWPSMFKGDTAEAPLEPSSQQMYRNAGKYQESWCLYGSKGRTCFESEAACLGARETSRDTCMNL